MTPRGHFAFRPRHPTPSPVCCRLFDSPCLTHRCPRLLCVPPTRFLPTCTHAYTRSCVTCVFCCFRWVDMVKQRVCCWIGVAFLGGDELRVQGVAGEQWLRLFFFFRFQVSHRARGRQTDGSGPQNFVSCMYTCILILQSTYEIRWSFVELSVQTNCELRAWQVNGSAVLLSDFGFHVVPEADSQRCTKLGFMYICTSKYEIHWG